MRVILEHLSEFSLSGYLRKKISALTPQPLNQSAASLDRAKTDCILYWKLKLQLECIYSHLSSVNK